jgi:hypothetical protein
MQGHKESPSKQNGVFGKDTSVITIVVLNSFLVDTLFILTLRTDLRINLRENVTVVLEVYLGLGVT